MRASLILLAVMLATLRVVEAAFGRRVRRVSLVPADRRRSSAAIGVSELSLPDNPSVRGRAAEAGRQRAGKSAEEAGDRPASRFAEWRYYGFSNHAAEADASVETPDVVASSPAVGSVVTILPDDCITTVVNGCVYRQCGSVWYQRQSTGSNVTYVVVPAP